MMWFCGQQEIVIRQIGEVWNDTIGEKPSYGRKWRAGDQCAAASMRVNIHFLMLTAALLALLMKCLYRRLEALITEIMVKAAQQTQQNPQETQFQIYKPPTLL